jgi:hypothetical protein
MDLMNFAFERVVTVKEIVQGVVFHDLLGRLVVVADPAMNLVDGKTRLGRKRQHRIHRLLNNRNHLHP